MIRKIFTNPVVFISVFIAVSIIADLYYHDRISSLVPDPENKAWTSMCDFRVFWTAGYKLNNYILSSSGRQDGKAAAGEVRSQDLKYEKELEDYIGGDMTRVYDKSEPFYHFRYSPLAAFLMAPLALIHRPTAALTVWFIVLNAAMLASLMLLTRQISLDFDISRNVRYLILWSTFIISMKFYLMNIAIGQSDVLIALFFVLFLMAYIRDKDIVCGMIFAMIIQFKPLFLPMLCYFLLIGKGRLVLSAILSSIAFFFAPAAIIGFGKTAALLKDWMEILSLSVPSQLLNNKNQSVTYFIGKSLLKISALNLSITAERLLYLLSAILTASAYMALLLFRRSSGAGEDKKFKYLEVSFLIIITLLFSPLVWVAHFISIIIPAGAMALFLSASRERKLPYAALACFVALSLVAGTDITRFIPVFNKGRFVNIALGTIFLAYALIDSYRQQA